MTARVENVEAGDWRRHYLVRSACMRSEITQHGGFGKNETVNNVAKRLQNCLALPGVKL